MSDVALFCFLLVGFLAGSVPFGLLLVRLAGKGDVRSVGSGNIGATNVARAGGRRLGILTLAFDVLKGFLSVFLVRHFGLEDTASLSFMALAAVAGHVFTPWLRFKGGKGVATALGVALAFDPWIVLPSLGVFVLAVALTRYVSLGSILGACALPVFLLIGLLRNHATGQPLAELLLTFTPWMMIALLVIIKHHANVARLFNGTENPLWGKRRGSGADE